MSLEKYGFQKLLLLNSAGYSRAEFPLDDSVSLIAPNNTGKTSLINALQFLLILDKRHMGFGAHSIDNTRRFYFPGNSAYIMLEVLLPSGMAVIGCVGKGLSHDYEYFAYQGSLDPDDYRLDNELVAQTQLISRLLECGKTARVYPQAELRALLYGNRQKLLADEPNLTIFPLEFTSQAATYQRILTRTLHLDRLDSREVKNYLLEIFKNDLQDRNVDFKSEWDKSFADVNYDKSQYDAVDRNKTLIAAMQLQQQQRLGLRGRIILWRPIIEQGLNDWEAYFNNKTAVFKQQLELVITQAKALEDRQASIYKEQFAAELALKEQNNIESHFQALILRFEVVKDLAQLESHRSELQNKRDELVRIIGNAQQQQSPESINRNIKNIAREKSALEQQLATIGNNFYLRLKELLSEDSFTAITRLLSQSVLSLPTSKDKAVALHNPRDFQSFAAKLDNLLQENKLQLPGLSLDISSLQANLTIKTAQELAAEVADCGQQLQEKVDLLIAVQNLTEKKQEKVALEKDIEAQIQDIKDYREMLDLKQNAVTRQQTAAALQQKLDALGTEVATLSEHKKHATNQQEQLKAAQNELGNQHQRIHAARQQRQDHHPPYTFLNELPNLPCMDSAELLMSQLAERIENYNGDCRRLRQIDDDLERKLSDLHREGINKFQTQDTAEHELAALFNYTGQLNQEQAAIERKARSAVVQVAAILRDLRNSLDVFKRRMHDFNKKISRHQLSDLKVFKIEPREEEALVNAIQTLIATSEQVESGESFDLFDQNAVLDDKTLNKAKDMLIKEGEARGGLRVEHLFRLVFSIAKENQSAAEFEDIDSAASNGTVLMAKLITGLAMLNQMQDPRKAIKTACYLDEAASLDQQNQRNLIAIAAEFGFALIFASPEPQITARYCVPIVTDQGKNHISRLHWQILENIDEAGA